MTLGGMLMVEKKNRREFIKSSAVATIGVLGGLGVTAEVLAQTKIKSLNKATQIKKLTGSREERTVMPNGALKTRAEILQQLGFNPNTPPDAWLTVGPGCGVNAAALNESSRRSLMQRGYVFEGNELINLPQK